MLTLDLITILNFFSFKLVNEPNFKIIEN